ncbi:MAG TPA: PRC-barrel domain-containing protein [Pirellulales bacterium]|nr:PRC-barrel domain-containing protein [Pirellulales bacterium]
MRFALLAALVASLTFSPGCSDKAGQSKSDQSSSSSGSNSGGGKNKGGQGSSSQGSSSQGSGSQGSSSQGSSSQGNSSQGNSNGGKAKSGKAKVDNKTKGDALRVSQVRGMTVRNSKDKELGEIEEVMLDMSGRGHIRYAALSFGGFMGIGDKLIAVPWRAVKFHHDSDRNKNYAVFDVTEKTLTEAPGFDKDHWPDLADRRWMEEVDTFHDLNAYKRDQDAQGDSQTDDNQETAGAPRAERRSRLHRGGELLGMVVQNAVGDELGRVEDIVVGMNSDDIRYLALSFGGFLGMGDKFFALPCQAVRVQRVPASDESFLLFDVTKDQLKQASGFKKDQWPDSGNEEWTLASKEEFKAKSNRPQSAGKKSK